MSQSLNPEYQGKKKAAKPLSDAEMIAAAAAKHEEQFAEQSAQIKVPTEIVELPSKGKLYPDGHPLRAGKIEMKYMTAKEEDILTNQSYIKNGVVLDKLFQSLIVTKFDYNDLLLCDKNAIMVAARVLGYGKDYPIKVESPSGETVEHTIDLTTIEDREIDWDQIKDGTNHFEYELPASKRKLTFSLLTHGKQKKVDAEKRAMKKLKKDEGALTTMLKYVITSVDGNKEQNFIRKFVDQEFFAIDSRAFRKHIKTMTPDLDLNIEIPDPETGEPFRSTLTIGLDFFWPDSGL